VIGKAKTKINLSDAPLRLHVHCGLKILLLNFHFLAISAILAILSFVSFVVKSRVEIY